MPETALYPAIYIPCHTRRKSLERLCNSLLRSMALHSEQCPEAKGKCTLVFSADAMASEEVVAYARTLDWPYGKKEVIMHPSWLGADGNNLFCISQAREQEAVIILEEDAFVSSGFYAFAQAALTFYMQQPEIAAISLHNYEWNEEANLPFLKANNGLDVYGYQKVSPHGLAISQGMSKQFLDWKQANPDPDFGNSTLPMYMKQWDDVVWEKGFNKYLVDTGKTCIYPYYSVATKFGEPGVHVNKPFEFDAFQSPLQYGQSRDFRFGHTSFLRYDNYCEAAWLYPVEVNGKQYMPELDLYGCKQKFRADALYVITSKKVSNFVRSYGRHLKPHELNIVFDIEGDDFFLAKVQDIEKNKRESVQRMYKNWYYFYRDVSLKKVVQLKLFEVIKRIF